MRGGKAGSSDRTCACGGVLRGRASNALISDNRGSAGFFRTLSVGVSRDVQGLTIILFDRFGNGVRGGECRVGLTLSFLIGLLGTENWSRKSRPPSEYVRNILAMLSPCGDGVGRVSNCRWPSALRQVARYSSASRAEANQRLLNVLMSFLPSAHRRSSGR